MSPSQRRSLNLGGGDLGTSGGAGSLSRSLGSNSGSSSFYRFNQEGGFSPPPPEDHQQPDISNLATVNRAAKPYQREKSGGGTFGGGSTFGMLGLMGGSKTKKSWMTKATSKEGGPPKAKYVRRLILSVWEEKLSPQSFFMLLYQRPVMYNPVVALKGLITTLKVMQQGPTDFLGEAASCVGMVDEIGKHWGGISSKMTIAPNVEYGTDGYTTLQGNTFLSAASPSHFRSHLDVASVDLIARMSHLLVLKLHFHEQHPDFAVHFTAIPTMLGYDSVPVTGKVQDINALSRLLTVQDMVIKTQRLVFASQNENVRGTARWALLPLIEEAYTVFVACTFLLASLLELAAHTQGMETDTASTELVSWKQHVTVLLALREQYESQLSSLQAFYRQAESVPEVKSMKRVPMMPAFVPVALDGALNWRPLTMKSPMVRVAGLHERARINDEIDQLVEERSHRAEARSHLEESADNGIESKAAEQSTTVPQHRSSKTKEGWESFGGSIFPPEIETKQLPPQEVRADDWFFPSAVSEQGVFLDAISAVKHQSHENVSPSFSSHGALEEFVSVGRSKPVNQAVAALGTRGGVGPPLGPNVNVTHTASGLVGESPSHVDASPKVGKDTNDLWADFFPNASTSGGEPSVQKPSPEGPKPQKVHKEVSIDLLAWSSSSELDSDEDSEEEGDEEVVAYTTKNMGDFLGTAVVQEKDDILGSLMDGDRIVSQPAPPACLSHRVGTSQASQPLLHPPGPVTAIVTAPTPPIVEDSKARARKKEARSQPWRQNLKPNVAKALAACVREFEESGTVLLFDQIVVGNVIGHGAFATVYRGTCLQGTDVAIKKLMTQNHLPMAEKSVRDFCSEVALLRQLKHPNIIALVRDKEGKDCLVCVACIGQNYNGYRTKCSWLKYPVVMCNVSINASICPRWVPVLTQWPS